MSTHDQTPATAGAERDQRVAPRHQHDPVTRAMIWAVWAGVILFLLASILALWVGWFRRPAPRTFEERRIALLEDVIKTKPSDPQVWAEYAAVLISARQYARAGDVIEEGLRRTKRHPLLLAAQASLAEARGDDEQAMVLADRALKAAQKSEADEIAALAEKGVIVTEADIEAPGLVAAALIKGDVASRTGQWQKAIDAYTAALSENPRMADVLVRRGDAYAALGDKAAAEADYRAALTYVSDLKEAREGLKKIGADK